MFIESINMNHYDIDIDKNKKGLHLIYLTKINQINIDI